MMKGIDISNYQTGIDYNKVREAGIRGAYVKATEGTTFRDKMCNTHYTGLRAQGIQVGFYHFLRAKTVDNAKKQGDFFVNTIKNYSPDLKYACDVETTEGLSREALSSCVRAFIDRVKELTGIECIVYTGSSFSKTNLTTILKGTKLWVAHYTTGDPSFNTDIWSSWSGWQYSSSGSINGINGNVDLDNYKEDLLIEGRGDDSTSSSENPLLMMQGEKGLIARLQNECNLRGYSNQVVDGIAGINTLRGCPTLSFGSREKCVQYLQEFLNNVYGFNVKGIDGIFGSNTENAVKEFQRKNRLTVDGIAGQNTWRKILRL